MEQDIEDKWSPGAHHQITIVIDIPAKSNTLSYQPVKKAVLPQLLCLDSSYQTVEEKRKYRICQKYTNQQEQFKTILLYNFIEI